ncbi:fimbrial biogenesis usher protein [Leclercia tamurae]|uniref:Fimbrial biogenesis usher protein n=1 Tax=Leclercia tamurae TaxID=2926467 RepID=A0ABT2R5I2_9ENTR|nr:fimbrial biogenesis usher protein [Leclercia tamurae]MCU6676134.1 fimbrial biogenesis usher protein [Leclercia tamurae]
MFKRTLLMCAVSLICSRQGKAADIDTGGTEFDSETLKSLGINPGVSEYFAHKSRFMPGSVPVNLKVNSQDKGHIVAQIQQDGELCFDRTLMEHAGVRVPDDYRDGCYDYLKTHPEVVVNAQPGQELIALIVPPGEINRQRVSPADFAMGGTGAVLNYSAMSSRSEYNGGSTNYSQAQLDGGINAAGWLLRSHQLLSQSEGKFSSENSQTWLQRTFVDLHTTARMGEVSMNNALLEGTGLYGIALSPENSLNSVEGRVNVSGIANTSQARVEVRQQGILVYSTLVPVGPFTLTDVSLRNYTSDLNVTVVETDGSQHSFILPSSLYLQKMGNPAGLFLSIGRVSDDYSEQPLVASVSGGWRLLPGSNANLGLILAENFQAAGLGIDTAPSGSTLLSLKVNQSNDSKHSLQGQSYRLEGSIVSLLGISITASSAWYSQGYREFSQFIDKNFTALKQHEYSVGLQWQTDKIGTFSTSFYETKNRNRNGKSRYITAGWGKNILSAYVSANWQHQLGGGDDEGKTDDLFYLNVSFPLGKSSVNTYARREGDISRFGSTVAGNLSDDHAYTLGAEAGEEEKDRSVSAGLSSNLHYTQLMMNANVGGEHQRNYSGSLQGGVMAHANGVTFSPLPVRETFGIVSLDQDVAGVKIDTPQGPVWTDYRGYAVLPSLNAWSPSRVEVNTETLPKNMDIGNGTRLLNQGRGSVGKIQFKALTQRRVLVDVMMADGKKLPKNIAITDDRGNYLTTSVDEGSVFLNNAYAGQILIAQRDTDTCRIKLTLPEKAETDVFYEKAKGLCQ